MQRLNIETSILTSIKMYQGNLITNIVMDWVTCYELLVMGITVFIEVCLVSEKRMKQSVKCNYWDFQSLSKHTVEATYES